MILNGRILTTLVMLTVFAGMSLLALGYPAKARFLPLLVGIPGTIMCLAQLVLDIRQALGEVGPRPPLDAEALTRRARELKMFAWLAAFFAGILAFGFLFAAPVLVAAYLRFAERERWLAAVVGGLGTWIVIYVVFGRLLELYVFDGLVTPIVARALTTGA